MDMKKPKIVFAEGCFDNFEGTQEELDELVAEIQRLVDTGEIFEKSVAVDVDNLDDDELAAFASEILSEVEGVRTEKSKKVLQ